ncbi:MAG: 30S ribosomal protein S1 [Bacteroidales bacterium]|jgi:small subunit ribosomal protein S1|nr:30S ribosomal protein S1 [Bacteroidales bacterium]MDY0400368.1 30S ribosomal protein S1 [Bacteroidales bacterium]HOB76895.1 30S ribosomal protein S1 [Bacteroidales bacterium]
MENEKNFQPEMNQNEVDKTEEISNESEALSIDEDVKLIEEASDAVEAKQENTENDDFDWDALLKETREYKEEERKKLEEKYTASMNVLQDKEVIEGTVIGFGEREVFVNINYKSDGVIPLSEVRYNPDLKIGDKIEVYVESQDDGTGQLILSHKKARILSAWNKINELYDKNEIVQGYIKSRTKGGLIVDLFGIDCFLPGSQIDIKPIKDYDAFVGTTMDFKIVKINQEFKNVVVSHKAIIEEEIEAQKSEIISKLEKGQVLEGEVKNITSYGVFIDLGGIDGLIHITDLSWGRINHPEEIVQLEQKLNVVILDFDEHKKRIALGLKQLTPHPWDLLDPNLKAGDKVSGKIVAIADYGAFIEIIPGVEGLIHVSEMSWSQHLRSAQDFLKTGDTVEAIILSIDREERKMSLGIKQLLPDPWVNIKEKYPVGSKHKAKVRNFTTFGVFVELEEGVDGLIHISDLSWTKKIKHPSEFCKIGDELEVVVLEIDTDNRRLSLGHKQIEENPWEVYETVFTPDSIHQGKIIESRKDKGAIIELPYGMEAYAPASQLIKEDKTKAKSGETLDFMIVEFNKDTKKIIVSHTRTWETPKPSKSKKTKTAQSDSSTHTTLADLGIFDDIKEQLNNNEDKK